MNRNKVIAEKLFNTLAIHRRNDNYKHSRMYDVHGVGILQGSVINADGYKSNLSENHFHCVMYENGIFGCDIYSDFEPLQTYKNIEVVGHAEDYREIYEHEKWSGNLGEGLLNIKCRYNFYEKHEDMQEALDKVAELGLKDEYVSKLASITVTTYIRFDKTAFDLINASLEDKADALFELVKEME